MDRVAVFVDAGYLFAQGSKELCGTRLTRANIRLDHQVLIATLKDFAESLSGLPLLRIYWYDGTSQGPTPQHITLADQADVKVRLGFVNPRGEQKGVDSLVVTDMLTLARNGAMAECVLLSGDEDLRVGVQQAQELGVRVHLLGIKPARGSQSTFLIQEADSTHEWTAEELGAFLDCRPARVVSPAQVDGEQGAPASDGTAPDALPSSSRLQEVAQRIAREVAPAEAFLGRMEIDVLHEHEGWSGFTTMAKPEPNERLEHLPEPWRTHAAKRLPELRAQLKETLERKRVEGLECA